MSTLSFLATVRIALVLGCECPRLWGWAKEHLGDLHPVAAITTCEERFFPVELTTEVLRKSIALTELVAPAEEGGAVVDPRRTVFEKSNWNIAVLEG